jgi:hypothetical protein
MLPDFYCSKAVWIFILPSTLIFLALQQLWSSPQVSGSLESLKLVRVHMALKSSVLVGCEEPVCSWRYRANSFFLRASWHGDIVYEDFCCIWCCLCVVTEVLMYASWSRLRNSISFVLHLASELTISQQQWHSHVSSASFFPSTVFSKYSGCACFATACGESIVAAKVFEALFPLPDPAWR